MEQETINVTTDCVQRCSRIRLLSFIRRRPWLRRRSRHMRMDSCWLVLHDLCVNIPVFALRYRQGNFTVRRTIDCRHASRSDRLYKNTNEQWSCVSVELCQVGDDRDDRHFLSEFRSLGGAKGPGLFFVLPCVDSIMKVDLRTGNPLEALLNDQMGCSVSLLVTFDVPPQEILTRDSVVSDWNRSSTNNDERTFLRLDCLGWRCGLFPYLQSNNQRDQCGEFPIFHPITRCYDLAKHSVGLHAEFAADEKLVVSLGEQRHCKRFSPTARTSPIRCKLILMKARIHGEWKSNEWKCKSVRVDVSCFDLR